MKYFSLLFLFAFFVPLTFGQINLSIEQQRNQIQYIKHDTLPVLVKPLPACINSYFSEYNGLLFQDSLFFFTSMRSVTENDNSYIFEPHWESNIYVAKLTPKGYEIPTLLPKMINNRHYFNSNYSFNHDKTILYFTRCQRNMDKELQCSIWESHFVNNRWKKPILLTKLGDKEASNTTQPFLVEMNDHNILYFSSNRKGGYGGMDIWYVVVKDGVMSEPINLGNTINSSGNEITPFYDTQTNTLYFSSDEWIGIGGYDIFFSQGALSDFAIPTNMGVPFNSEENDLYFSINKGSKNGYFSSNRPHVDGLSGDTCCTDIFSYEWILPETISKQDTSQTIDSIAQMIDSLLPITLYFHNDEPDARSVSATTTQNYRVTFYHYYELKELYKEKFCEGLSGVEREAAALQIDNFFTHSVEHGFLELRKLTYLIKRQLLSGRDVLIEVVGFASPLHQSDYNYNLSSRRIVSLKNYFYEYESGFFIPYMNGSEDAHFKIIEKPYGSQSQVSADPLDTRNSIYSVAAAKERRIEIRFVKANNKE